MIGELKPYPAYKDSGLPWLGEVPEHWQVLKQRRIIQIMVSNVDKNVVDNELSVRLCNYVDVYKNEEITNRLAFMRGSATSDEIKKFRLNKGDVLITKDSETWNDIGVPALVSYQAPDLVCGYHLAILRPNIRLLGSYLLRALQSQGVAAQYHISANGVTRYGLSQNAIKNILLPLPPLEEQTQIATFLDYADRRIRRYIRSKQKLIKLLEEQKQVIINQAVTRGLDPNAPLKPSGIEWLGGIPEHWSMLQLRRLVSTVTSGSRGWAEFYSDDGEIFIQSGNLGRLMALNLSFIQHVKPPQGSEGTRTKIQKDDILICITGALTGNVVLVDVDLPTAYVNQHVGLTRPKNKEIFPRFLAYCLHSRIGQSQFKTTEYGGTKQGLGLNDVKSVVVPIPSRDEQVSIVTALDRRLEKLTTGIANAQKEISLLQEFRTRLIADIVTGKLDVREAAAQLPVEVNDPEPLDDDLPEDDLVIDDDSEPDAAPEDEAA